MAIKGYTIMDFKIYFIFTLIIGTTYGFGTYSVLHAPSYLQYQPSVENQLHTTELHPLIQTTFGFTPDEDFKWEGLSSQNPFKRPKAQLLVSIQDAPTFAANSVPQSAMEKLVSAKAEHTYRIFSDIGASELSTEALSEHMKERVSAQSLVVDFSVENAVFEFQSGHPSLFGHLPNTLPKIEAIFTGASQAPFNAGSMNVTVKEDAVFLGQAYLMNGVIDAIVAKPELAKDAFPDFYHFQVSGWKALVEKYHGGSQQIKDAEQILMQLIEKASQALQKLYNGNVVVQVITYSLSDDELLTGKPQVRGLKQDPTPTPSGGSSLEEKINKSEGFGENYAVTFNIILWLMIILALVIYAVGYGVWNMDPGTDSIIYRMTSQRMKRD